MAFGGGVMGAVDVALGGGVMVAAVAADMRCLVGVELDTAAMIEGEGVYSGQSTTPADTRGA